MCAFSGVLIGPITTVYYDSGFLVSLKGFVGAIIGGLVELPARRGGRAAGRVARSIRIVLGEQLQGGDRLHADHPGAAVAQPRDASSRGRRRAMRRQPATPALWGYALFLAVIVAVPLFAPQFWVTLGNYIGLYSIVALGLVLLTGVAGQTSFGQAAFVGIGAYTTAILTTHYGWSPWLNLVDWPRADAGARAMPGVHHAADERSLPAARDDRVGHQPLFPVRQSRAPRGSHRDHRHPRARRSPASN